MKKGIDKFLENIGNGFFNNELNTEAGRVNLRSAVLIFIILGVSIGIDSIDAIANFVLKLLGREDSISLMPTWVLVVSIVGFFIWNFWCLHIVGRIEKAPENENVISGEDGH